MQTTKRGGWHHRDRLVLPIRVIPPAGRCLRHKVRAHPAFLNSVASRRISSPGSFRGISPKSRHLSYGYMPLPRRPSFHFVSSTWPECHRLGEPMVRLAGKLIIKDASATSSIFGRFQRSPDLEGAAARAYWLSEWGYPICFASSSASDFERMRNTLLPAGERP